jgi:acyl-CoA reductase-like NAD-dependent aldehyde dehydrogenase
LCQAAWRTKVGTIRLRDQAFIDGGYTSARSGRTFPTANPATDAVLAEVAACAAEDIDRAVAAACRSFESGAWSRAKPSHRKEVLLRLANDTQYGVAASVWTDSLSRAHRVAASLRAGTVSVNIVDALSPMTAFGGVKQSGFGRDLSLQALDKYTALKTTWIKY